MQEEKENNTAETEDASSEANEVEHGSAKGGGPAEKNVSDSASDNASAKERTPLPWSKALFRGLSAGVLVAVVCGLVDGFAADTSLHELSGGDKAKMAFFAVGIMALLTVPLGIFTSLGLASILQGRTLTGWFAHWGENPAKDAAASRTLLGFLGMAATWIVGAGVVHAVFLHTLNNPLLASVFAAILAAGLVPAGVLAGAITQRLLGGLARSEGLRKLGKPYASATLGIIYVELGALAVVGLAGLAKFYDPGIWSPVFLFLLLFALVGPALVYLIAVYVAGLRRVTDSPIFAAIAVAAVAVLAYQPFATFTADDPIRLASFETTQLEKRFLVAISGLGDRDADGFSGILGGPDCDDSDPLINPGAFDEPANGIDENCVGGDAKVVVREKRSTVPARVVRAIARAGLMGATVSVGMPNVTDTGPVVDLKGKNAIILIVDTVRADHLGYMGYDRATSPNMDRIAAQSVNFSMARAHAPNTPRSMPSLFGSRYPSEIPYVHPKYRYPAIKDDLLTVYEVLESNGYVNHFLASHWYFREERNLHDGFAEWDNAGSKDIAPSNTDVSSPRIFDRFGPHLDRLTGQEKPWTLTIHLADPHGRYLKHPGVAPDFGDTLKDKYDADVAFTDVYIGKMWDELEARGLLENTAVILTSDHGEGFKEHGHLFHGQTIYEEILRVPLLMYIPGVPPTEVKTAVGVIDIAPTLLDAAGIPIPDAFSGRSLVPGMLDPENGLPEIPFYAELMWSNSWEEEIRALVVGDKKILWKATLGKYEVYDLSADPGEKKDLYRKDKELAAEMKAAITAFVEGQLRRP